MTLALHNNNYLDLEDINLDSEEFKKLYVRFIQDKKENTINTYLTGIEKFNNWLKENSLSALQIEYENLLDYVSYLRGHEEYNEQEKKVIKISYKETAINSYIHAIKSLYKFLELKGYCRNYAKYVNGIKISKIQKRDNLTIEQVKTIFSNIDTTNLKGARDNAIIKLLIGTGLRQCEIVEANIEDLKNIGNKRVLYVKGKGSREKDKYVVIEPSVENAINNYLKFRRNAKASDPLFTSYSDRNNNSRLTTRTIRNIVKNLYLENGLVSDRLTTHSTRHTAITLGRIGGAKLEDVRDMARHSDISTTAIYFHNVDRLENSAESVIENLLNS